MAFRVGILGVGRIASGFDVVGSPDSYTHLSGILSEKRLSLAAVADLRSDHAAAEISRFGVEADVVSIPALLSMDLDVICIATPDGTHLDYAEAALEGPARLLLIEKPLEKDSSRRSRLLQVANETGKAVAAHHIRRWIPGLSHWLDEAEAGEYGRPVSAVAWYTRGFRHNGTHVFDLVGACLGVNVMAARPIAAPITDFSTDDPTLSLQVTLDIGNDFVPFTLLGVDGRRQTAFEVDIRFERARIRVFDENGVRATLLRNGGDTQPGFSPELVPVSSYHDRPARLPKIVWKNVADYLEYGQELACAGNSILVAYDMADAILAKVVQ